MFDIGFSELLLVMVIGLVVLGPERLPVAVKTVAGWIRALRSLASTVQNELVQEMKLQELQDSLKKVEQASQLQNLSPELKASMDELKEAAEAMKRPHGIKLDGSDAPEHVPLADPEAAHDGVLEAERNVAPAVTMPLVETPQPAQRGDAMTEVPPTAPVSADVASVSHAESKTKSEPTTSVSSSQPSGDR
ncbi:Sec-independent protein translocase protein TatB [Dickeya solani]|uniref:Sec-independent protein translocase protein TatB n=1 Tax=Dickeya solani TaxID=1089444 RepID=A0ABU4EEA0_9GAMM|nr:Sec-independent protein translocase protein TatB [Dickeya solani]MCA7001239.1 Sec-independent protein translocase protein TatB [Dickeya solani]MCZ0821678.1 Sec-independent protein translocase protein TatB [Dickeya solani]MDV6996409.1 Sec-independent protein translocase protein TatB [Dickeya solani]MDV7002184.1 Sec-independent protein translocase protein TatB [Dickeya solani]MDV7037244.1 Sec-independent protein translocase protein TatB [Dickeya solani]